MALACVVVPVVAFAGPPTVTEARTAIRALLIRDALHIDRIARGPNSFSNPTAADQKRDEEIRAKYAKMDIFIGEINKEDHGLYSVVYGIGKTTSVADVIQGAQGWMVKCYQTNSGAKRCE